MSEFGRLGIPLGARFYGAIFLAIPIAIFVFLASSRLEWFTVTRQIYLLFGVCSGLSLGFFEARTVIPKLAAENEAVVWQVLPVGGALFGFPWLVVIAVFGVSEYAPFGLYAFFPAMVAVLAASGWYFRKFEQQHQVRVFLFIYGFKYWQEPNPDARNRFYHFIRDLASKDVSVFWGHAGYAKTFMAELEKKQEIESSTRQQIFQVLKVMNNYRVGVLTFFAFCMIASLVLLILFFGTSFGYFQLTFKITDVLGPASGVIWLSLIVVVFSSMRAFKRKITRMLSTIDAEKLSSLS